MLLRLPRLLAFYEEPLHCLDSILCLPTGPRVIVECSKLQAFLNVVNSAYENWGPLSVMTASGTPYHANRTSRALHTALVVVVCRLSTSMKLLK